jgi:hypothetical protein
MKENTNVDYIEKKNTNVGSGSYMNQIESKLPTRPRRTNQLWKNELGISQIITIQPQQRQHPLFIEPPNSVFSFVYKDTVCFFICFIVSFGRRRSEVRMRTMMGYVTNHRWKRWKRNHRIWGAIAIFICCMCLILFTPSIPRSPDQHQFADVRNLLGNHHPLLI